MLRRILFIFLLSVVVVFVPAHAANIVCTLSTGPSGPATPQNCDTPLATPTASLDWASVLSPTGSSVSPDTPVTGTIGANTVTVASYDELEGAYNAGYVWNSADGAWEPGPFVSNATFFPGDFNTVTSPSTPTPPYGDDLLGILEPTGNSPGPAQVTLTFAQTLNFVEFQVTAAGNPNFVATLTAYDSNGGVLGTYVVNDTGTGGACASLNQGPPVPCSPTSPFVQFYDAQDLIASVELTVNDSAGAYIDTLSAASVVAPEPSSFAALGLGMLALLFWAIKHRQVAVSSKRPD